MRLQHAIILIIMFVATSCATLFKGQTAEVRLNSAPAGARIQINGFDKGVTPASINLKRNVNHSVTFTLDGYREVNLQIEPRFDVGTAVIGNLFSWSLFGLVVDVASGAAYSLTPADLQANFSSISQVVDIDVSKLKKGEMFVFMLTEEQWSEIKAMSGR